MDRTTPEFRDEVRRRHNEAIRDSIIRAKRRYDLRSNHAFKRPCPDPTMEEVAGSAIILMHVEPVQFTERETREAFFTLRDAFHGDAVAAGWHHDIRTGERKYRNMGEMLMLAVSELAEAMEGHRKNLQDDKLTHRPMMEVELADFVIRCFDTIALPMFAEWHTVMRPAVSSDISNVGHRLLQLTRYMTTADSMIFAGDLEGARDCIMYAIFGAFDLARDRELDLPGALVEKRAYNATRADHSVDARLQAGGKAY